MANEKVLNTRIQLKYDSYTNWKAVENTFRPLPGELCIVYLGETKDGTNGTLTASNTHPVLFKVGQKKSETENYTFAELPWASALAADVYAWAKAEKAPDEIDTRYNFSINNDGQLEVTETKYINEVAQTPSTKTYDFVTPNEMVNALKAYYTKDAIDKLLAGINDSVTTVVEGTGISVSDAGTDNDHAYTVSLNVEDAKTALGLGDAAYATVASLNTTASGYVDILKQEMENRQFVPAEANQVTNALTVTVGGSDVEFNGSAAKTVDIDAAIAAAIEAEGHPEYNIVKDATSEYAATYHLTKDGVNVGAAINIPKDLVVESGKVETLEAGVWGEAGTYIILTLANATNEKIYVRVDSLIEYVTSGSTADSQVIVDIDENHKVTATIGAGKVTATELAKAVKDDIAKGVEAHGWGNHANAGYLKNDDITGKADKVKGATEGNFAALDANGNLTDSGKKAADFAPAPVSGKEYLLNDGTNAANKFEIIAMDGITLEADAADIDLKADQVVIEGTLKHKTEGAYALAKDIPTSTDDIQAGTETWIFNCGTATTVI